MTLSNLIRKGGLATVATATPATLATHEVENAGTDARVATVAVAEPQVLTAEEETEIRTWFAHIAETDEDIISALLSRCRTDLEARAYFLRRTNEMPQPMPDDDDRRHCAQCVNLAPSGLCVAALRGDIVAGRTYHPVDHLPRRCEGYVPGPDDPDRRHGRDRWPEMFVQEVNLGR